MKTKKLTPGPIQKEWFKTLREHPERQWKEALGKIVDGEKKMCCLLQLADIAGFEFIHWEGSCAFIGDDYETLKNYGKYGLRDDDGMFLNPTTINDIIYHSLSGMNDWGMTWPEIADYVEANFENVFTKSY